MAVDGRGAHRIVDRPAQVRATLPANYITFAYPGARPDWWYTLIKGLSYPIVKYGMLEVWDTLALGVDFDEPPPGRTWPRKIAPSSIRLSRAERQRASP